MSMLPGDEAIAASIAASQRKPCICSSAAPCDDCQMCDEESGRIGRVVSQVAAFLLLVLMLLGGIAAYLQPTTAKGDEFVGVPADSTIEAPHVKVDTAKVDTVKKLSAAPKTDELEILRGKLYYDNGRLCIDAVNPYVASRKEFPRLKYEIRPADNIKGMEGREARVVGRYAGDGVIDISVKEGELFTLTELESAMIREANKWRATVGSPPVFFDPGLMRTARQHSANMRRAGRKCWHGGTSGWSAENVAWNQPDPVSVTNDWRNSHGHWSAMRNPRFEYIGVAGDNLYWTQQYK